MLDGKCYNREIWGAIRAQRKGNSLRVGDPGRLPSGRRIWALKDEYYLSESWRNSVVDKGNNSWESWRGSKNGVITEPKTQHMHGPSWNLGIGMRLQRQLWRKWSLTGFRELYRCISSYLGIVFLFLSYKFMDKLGLYIAQIQYIPSIILFQFFFFFFATLCGLRDLKSLARDGTCTLISERAES